MTVLDYVAIVVLIVLAVWAVADWIIRRVARARDHDDEEPAGVRIRSSTELS